MNVPSRNDAPAGLDLHARSMAHEIAGRDPGFVYEYKSTDPKHPQYFGNYLKRREIGNQVAGFTFVEPWELVRQDDVEQGRKRADDTKGVDTRVTHGSMVLMRTPKANADKAHLMNERVVNMQSASLAAGEKNQIERTRYGVKVFSGDMTSGAVDATVVSAQLTGGK
jgi:hypothetical protein